MSAALVLHGYGPSIYTRIARLALTEAGLPFRFAPADPFEGPFDPALNPFRQVPVLDHGGFRLHETAAITRYVAALAPEARLLPEEPRAAARMAQVIGILDAHGYWPMVRQVYARGVLGPLEGAAPEPAEVAAGLAAAEPVLDALDRIAAEGLVLRGRRTLADIHLAPMLAAFVAHPPALTRLERRSALFAWWTGAQAWDSLARTPLLEETP